MQHRQLEAYRAVMIAGSTVRAAELMGITQPAVSRLIAELEASIRFALFDRVRGRLVATPEGKRFFREVEASFKGIDRLKSAAASIRDYGEGVLRVATLAAAGEVLVPAAIRSFREAHPRIRITLHVTWSSSVRNGVADGAYDIGIAADEIDQSGVDTQLFGNFPGLVVMPRDHRLTEHQQICPEDLRDCPLIGLVPEDRARQRLDAILSEHDVVPHYVVETPSSSTVCSLVLSGDAVGIVSPLVADSFRHLGVAFRPFVPQIMFRAYLTFPPDTQKSQLTRAFVAELMRHRNRFSVSLDLLADDEA